MEPCCIPAHLSCCPNASQCVVGCRRVAVCCQARAAHSAQGGRQGPAGTRPRWHRGAAGSAGSGRRAVAHGLPLRGSAHHERPADHRAQREGHLHQLQAAHPPHSRRHHHAQRLQAGGHVCAAPHRLHQPAGRVREPDLRGLLCAQRGEAGEGPWPLPIHARIGWHGQKQSAKSNTATAIRRVQIWLGFRTYCC